MAQVIEIKGLDEVMKAVDSMTERNIEKDVRKIVRYVLQRAVKELRKDAREILPNDPRKAYQAVRSAVYKRLLGGQVNILARRKANNKQYVGGNIGQRGATQRTRQLAGYYGSDRGFILRFINAGTDDRTVKGLNGHSIKRKSTSERHPKGNQMNRAYRVRFYKGGIGNRGSIEARNWFGDASQEELEHAAGSFADLVERAIEELWNKGQITQQYNG